MVADLRGVSRTRKAAAGVGFIAIAVASACELADTTAPESEPRAVVHAVLNANSGQQIIIVERTLSSARTSAGTGAFDPINNARVVVYGPRQDSVIALRAAAPSEGAYRFPSITITDGSQGTAAPNVLRLRPGERYRLRVETSLGVVTGETILPGGGPIDIARRTFNVDRDTLQVNSAAVRSAAGYFLRHETRFNFADEYTTALETPLILPLAQVQGDPDDAKWLFSFARELVFPGFSQNFIVAAVDSNYFKYYVAGFDPFGDDTRGNTLTGGVGLFGSVATILSKTLDLTADIDTPIEGTWTADRPSATLPLTLTLYSSPFFPTPRTDGQQSLSGSSRLVNGRPLNELGSIGGSGVSLQFFDPVGETTGTAATGLLNNGVLVLTDTRTGERVTYRKG